MIPKIKTPLLVKTLYANGGKNKAILKCIFDISYKYQKTM